MRALGDVSLEIFPGERLAIVGENGAGKSSLMNVLYGLYRPDAGEVRVDGVPRSLRSPKDAIALGIGMVHQHFMLVPTLTVAENVILGQEPTRLGTLDLAAACAQVEATCARFGFRLDPRAVISELTVGSQQKVEIIKVLQRNARLLILDEPTAVLTPQEADELFVVSRAMSDAGVAVVFISHKLREVLAFASRIAVMRKGKKVAEVLPGQTSSEALANLMVGAGETPKRRGSTALTPSRVEGAPREPRPPTLELEGISADDDRGRAALRNVSLIVRPGEIVGIAGVDGNGQTELVEVVTGLRRAHTGIIRLGGEPVESPSPRSMRSRGVAHIPEDRLRRALVGRMSVEENAALGRHRHAPFASRGLIDFAGRARETASLLSRYDVRPPVLSLRAAALSGGNQQKLVVGRELDQRPQLLVAAQPTRGLDISAVDLVRRQLEAARQAGAAVLLVSLDLDELLSLSSRLYVLFEGAVQSELPRGDYDARRIGQLMLGARGAARA